MASATAAAISMRFPSPRTLVVARSNGNKPRKQLISKKPSNYKKKKHNGIHTTAPPPCLSSFSAEEVSRLPIKDDNFFLVQESPTQVKLKQKQQPSSSRTHKEEEEEDVEFDFVKFEKDHKEEEEGEEEEDEDEDAGFDYGKFELFEVNSDDEFDDEDDEYYDDDLEIDDEEEGKETRKGKGLPAVMRCFDSAKIYVRAGDGGNGVVAFRREKYVPFGGPSGGDGGRGGNVYMEVDGSMNSLLPFRQSIHFRAGRGAHGQGSNMNGAKGEDVVVKVPPGTVVRAAETDGVQGEVLLEFLQPGDRALVLPGGRGGRGNASFKSGTNKVPRIAENGEEAPEM